MIKISNLSKKFTFQDEKISIFEDLNINFENGVIHTVMGPSGSGKTTLLNMIAGLDNFDYGEILVNNISIGNLGENEKTAFRGNNISFIFQSFELINNLTVVDNIELGLYINNLKRRFETKEIIELVGLKGKENNYSFNLSGGEKQRVAIARAFVGDTKILLADEPTGNLDFYNTQKIIELIINLQKESKNTIIIITHDKEIAKNSHKNFKIENNTIIETK